MNNPSTHLQILDAEGRIISEHFRKIGRKGGQASRGTPQAKERARKAGKASAAAKQAKKQAAENEHSTFGYND